MHPTGPLGLASQGRVRKYNDFRDFLFTVDIANIASAETPLRTQFRETAHNDSTMSRLPPLPPGMPPRPQYPPPSSYGSESYRPRDDDYRQNSRRTYQQDAPPPYQFHGSHNGYDSRYGHGRQSPPRRRSPPRNNYPSRDDYRPRDNFTFRHDAPPGVDFGRSDTYRPQQPPPPPYRPLDNQNASGQPRHHGRRDDGSYPSGGRGGRSGYRGRGGPRRAADRDFLQTNRAPTPELMPGIDEDKGNGVRYRAPDEMSVSDDDGSDEYDNAEGPRKKQAVNNVKAADGDSVPRWSNPDPYTALPPPDESQRKKKDVVKLIRKARVTDGADASAKAGAVNDDFISFDLDEVEPAHDVPERSQVPTFGVPVNAPIVHKAAEQQVRASFAPNPSMQESLPSGQKGPIKISLRNKLPDRPTKAPVIDLTANPALGNRKRNIRDEIKLEAPRELNNNVGGKKKAADGYVISTWRNKPGSNPTPWIELDHSSSANMGLW